MCTKIVLKGYLFEEKLQQLYALKSTKNNQCIPIVLSA